MKNVEINSDKHTVIGILFFLALALLMFVSNLSNLYTLARYHLAVFDLDFWDYPVAGFNVYVAVIVCRDSKLRKTYPMGVAGICLMAVVLLMKIAMHWAKGSPGTRYLLWSILMVVSIAASGLVLLEGIRWFRKKVTLV